MTISDERLREITQTFPDGDAGKMAEELLQRRQDETRNLLCWRKERPEEDGGLWPETMADWVACEMEDDGERIERMLLAVSRPDRKMRVWLTGGGGREVHWEWL